MFYYGHATPAENPEHYKHLVEQLAQLLDRREALNAQVQRQAGLEGEVPRAQVKWEASGHLRQARVYLWPRVKVKQPSQRTSES